MAAPLIIGITGGSGSGKTSFLHALRERFSEEVLCILSLDDYYIPRDHQVKDDEGVVNFDRPGALDLEAFLADIGKLSNGITIEREEYTFNNALKEAKKLVFKPAPILALEGLFVFHEEKIRQLMDYKVFIHAAAEVKVIRRIRRDGSERNYPLDDVLYRYEHHVLPSFQKYIAKFQEESDLVINNNVSFEKGLEVLEGFMRWKLGGVGSVEGIGRL